MITTEQRANLSRLADYLESGPALRFDMERFCSSADDLDVNPQRLLECGTAACSAGHGPFAGLALLRDEEWADYCVRVFGFGPDDVPSENPAFLWMFDCDWTATDNTPDGAAARIRWFLAYGVPANAEDQITGIAPLCYRERVR